MKPSWIIMLVAITFCIVALIATAPMVADMPASGGQRGTNNELQKNPASAAGGTAAGQPPTEAIASCTGKSAGDTCQFTDRQGTSTGICDDRPGVLACAPARDASSGQAMGDKPAAGGMTAQPGATRSATNRTSPAQPVLTASTAGTGSFVLTSTAGTGGSTLPAEYSCDGAGITPALSWSGAPSGTKEYALMVTTIPVDGSTRWNWVLYGIPGSATSLEKGSTTVGTVGTGSHGTVMMYDPPCPQGSGTKTYTFTLYALSASPSLPSDASRVTGEVLTSAIQSITLGKASFDLNYARAS